MNIQKVILYIAMSLDSYIATHDKGLVFMHGGRKGI